MFRISILIFCSIFILGCNVNGDGTSDSKQHLQVTLFGDTYKMFGLEVGED